MLLPSTESPASTTLPEPTRKSSVEPLQVETFIEGLFGEDLHASRVLSLTNATIGVLGAAALGEHAIGLALAEERGLNEMHAVKQVDRLSLAVLAELLAADAPTLTCDRARRGLDRPVGLVQTRNVTTT